MNRKYLAAGLILLAVLGFAEYKGMSTTSVARAEEPVPPSVRDNPGAYRAHYVHTGRYVGGK